MSSRAEPASARNRGTKHDVFISYHGADRERVSALRTALAGHGINAFLDRTCLVAGRPWPPALEDALRQVRGVLVFVGGADGSDGLGFWQRRETWFALDYQAQKEAEGQSFPVIPVLLPGAEPSAGFLFLNTWIDLRDDMNEEAAIDAIVRAISSNGCGSAEPVVPARVCPYRGLEPFREEHAGLFYGRESFSSELFQRVTARPLVALLGQSGSGKSSVIHAGLVPLLRRRRPPEHAWDAIVFRPGDAPFHRLAGSLVPLLEPEADEIRRLEAARQLGEKMADRAIRIEAVIDRVIAKSNGTGRLLIVADQFEELLTATPETERRRFVYAVMDALGRSPFTLLLSLRADFYGNAIALDRRLSDQLQGGLVNLGPMTREELRRGIESPAARSGIHFERGLVDRILDHVELQPGGLPLLEFAVTQLWESRSGSIIQHSDYDRIGEVAGAISRRAENVLRSLSDEDAGAALNLFSRLIRVTPAGDPEPDTRRRIELDTFDDASRLILKPFIDARLLVVGRDASVQKETLELAHEALIRGWNRLGEWLERQREFLLWRQRLDQMLGEWRRTSQNKAALLRGPALKDALQWAQQRKGDLTSIEETFIRRSRRRQLRRRGWLAGFVTLIAVLLAAWPMLGFLSQTNAAVAWGTGIMAHSDGVNARPSVVAEWVHVLDVAGSLDTLGSGIPFFPMSELRARAMERGALLLAYEGKMAEAGRLADRLVQLTKNSFDLNLAAQISFAEMMHAIGRNEAAQQYARRAAALANQEEPSEQKMLLVADSARVLAAVGLRDEALKALRGLQLALLSASSPATRVPLADATAAALVQLGSIEQAVKLLSDRAGWPMPLTVLQAIVDRGYLDQGRNLCGAVPDPFAAAIVASALLSHNRSADAKELIERAVTGLEKTVGIGMGPVALDATRSRFYEHLLLKVMSPADAVALVRDRTNPDALASLAIVLASTEHTAIVRATAGHVRLLTLAFPVGRSRILAKIAEALAASGVPEEAASLAETIQDEDDRAVALAHVAYAFVAQGNPDKARDLVNRAAARLPMVPDRDPRSLLWANVSLVRVRLGKYADAVDNAGYVLNPSEILSVYTAIAREEALRRNTGLRASLDRHPAGFGRYGLHWP